jgi:hypothetical protein
MIFCDLNSAVLNKGCGYDWRKQDSDKAGCDQEIMHSGISFCDCQ